MRRILNFIFTNKASIMVFLTVGTFTTSLYFITFALMWNVFGINYRVAVSMAYILSTCFHFFANRNLTFKSRNHSIGSQLPRYLVMIGINYIVTLLTVSLVVENLQFSPYLGICCAVSVTLVITYLMSYFWVFASSFEYSRR